MGKFAVFLMWLGACASACSAAALIHYQNNYAFAAVFVALTLCLLFLCIRKGVKVIEAGLKPPPLPPPLPPAPQQLPPLPLPPPPKISDLYDFFSVRITGVTFMNSEKSRQDILRLFYFCEPPYDTGVWNIGLREYEHEGERAIGVCLNDEQVGEIPRTELPWLLENLHRFEAITRFDVAPFSPEDEFSFDEDQNKRSVKDFIYSAELTIRFFKETEPTPDKDGSDSLYDYFTTRIAGVTSKNKDKSRQEILRLFLLREPPYKKGEGYIRLLVHNYNGEPALSVHLNDDQIGYIPKSNLPWLLENLHRVDGIAAFDVSSFTPEDEEFDSDDNTEQEERSSVIYAAKLTIRLLREHTPVIAQSETE